jgi:hypothetical protein
MEKVLDVYKRPHNPLNPVVCMDESPKQLIGETKVPIPASKGQPARHVFEYVRDGVCNIFIACEPLSGKRIVSLLGTSLNNKISGRLRLAGVLLGRARFGRNV